MNHCKVPCKECPFTKNSLAGWLADYTPEDLHGIVMNEIPFPCHMTHDENLAWDKGGSKENPLCAGALLYMKKACKMPRNAKLAQIVKNIDYKETDNILSVPEFFKHHTIK